MNLIAGHIEQKVYSEEILNFLDMGEWVKKEVDIWIKNVFISLRTVRVSRKDDEISETETQVKDGWFVKIFTWGLKLRCIDQFTQISVLRTGFLLVI
jgi:hypothetical protein